MIRRLDKKPSGVIRRLSGLALLITFLFPGLSYALSEIAGIKATDVTASSFSIIWMTNFEGEPNVEIYSDAQMLSPLNDKVGITKMAGASSAIKAAALRKGNIRVMVSGLNPNTTYYVRAVMADSQIPATVSYSELQEVTTALKTVSYRIQDGLQQGLSNDLVSFKSFIPANSADSDGIGDLMILEVPNSKYPLSAYVGQGIKAPEALFDLNNLYGSDGLSSDIPGGDRLILTVYKGGLNATVQYYRKLATNSGNLNVAEPQKGFFADVNMDGKVDESDFELFKIQYGNLSSDPAFNPDFDFTQDSSSAIDARDFSKFSIEYGRQDFQ